MAARSFSAGSAPRLIISRVSGDVTIEPGDDDTFLVESDGRPNITQQEGEALVIDGCDDDLELIVPHNTVIELNQIDGDVDVQGGQELLLRKINGDLEVSTVQVVRATGNLACDVRIEDVAEIELNSVGADVHIINAERVAIRTVGSDLHVEGLTGVLRCGTVGSDCTIEGEGGAEVMLESVGSDLEVEGVSTLQVARVGSDCTVKSNGDMGDVTIGKTGSDLNLTGISGNIKVGSVGSDASLRTISGSVELGRVGSELDLQSNFVEGSLTRCRVGSDATVRLPNNPDVRFSATVGGEVSGDYVNSSGGGTNISMVYGAGAATLELWVGSDLTIKGGGVPTSSSSSSGTGKSFNYSFDRDMSEFGREMGELGRELGEMGREIGREIAEAFRESGWSKGSAAAESMASRMEEKARRMEERAEAAAQRAEARARHREERAEQQEARVRVRFNEREWQLDPERLERIKEQARKAAAGGLAGALEAVERAIARMVPPAPTPPTPPDPVTPPTPPTPPAPPAPPEWPPVTGQTIRLRVETEDGDSLSPTEPKDTPAGTAAESRPAAAVDVEQERMAILQMIAEGRISPEEGDLLLEALGNT